MEINRLGKVTEYKKGHYYLSHTEWEDGHCEIEVHSCVPQLIFHSCDSKQLPDAKMIFANAENASPTEHKILDKEGNVLWIQ